MKYLGPPVKYHKGQTAPSPTEMLSAEKRFDSETFPDRSLSTQGKLQWATQPEHRAFSDLLFSGVDSVPSYWNVETCWPPGQMQTQACSQLMLCSGLGSSVFWASIIV